MRFPVDECHHPRASLSFLPSLNMCVGSASHHFLQAVGHTAARCAARRKSHASQDLRAEPKNPPESNNAFRKEKRKTKILGCIPPTTRHRKADTPWLRAPSRASLHTHTHPPIGPPTNQFDRPHCGERHRCSFFGHRCPIPQELNRVIITRVGAVWLKRGAASVTTKREA